jgi:hypothetical protein
MLEKKEIIEILTDKFYAWVDYCAEFTAASASPEAGDLDDFFTEYARILLEAHQDAKRKQVKTVAENIERLSEKCMGGSEDIVEDLLDAIRDDSAGSGTYLETLESLFGEKTLKIWNKHQGESSK